MHTFDTRSFETGFLHATRLQGSAELSPVSVPPVLVFAGPGGPEPEAMWGRNPLSSLRPGTVLASQTQARTQPGGHSAKLPPLPRALGIRHRADPVLKGTDGASRRGSGEHQR